MSSSLTELRRQTRKVIRPVIAGRKTVSLTDHGREVARIVPRQPVNYEQACRDLIAIGPVKLPRRK